MTNPDPATNPEASASPDLRDLMAASDDFQRVTGHLERVSDRLEQINERLEATLNALPDILFELDAEGRVLSYRSAAREELYLPPERFLGHKLAALLPPDVYAVVERALGEMLEHGRHSGATYVLPMADGPRWYELSGSRMGRAADPGARLVVLVRDVTRRMRAEEAVRVSARRLSEALRLAHMGCWDYDVASDLFTFDDQYYAMHRTTAAEQGGYQMAAARFAHTLVHPEESHRVAAVIGEALAATDPDAEWQFESRIRCADGDVRWISVWFRIEQDALGRTTRLSGVNQDITDRKRAEDEKERLQAQLLQSQKMESIGRLAGGVAHDFNNMLQVVLGGIDLVLDDATLDGAAREYLLEARRTAHRSADLTARLLGFARRQTVSPRRLDLNGTVAGMQSMLRRLIGENIDLAWEPGPALWPVRVDPSQIDQILANLAVNARDAITRAGRVTLSTANVALGSDACAERPWVVPGDYVCLTVSDTGCGMGPDVLAHLFEPFFTTKEQGKGTGLGLATVYGIVKQNGGLIDVASVPGTGTSVRVYLPRCVADGPDPGSRPSTAAPNTGRETVLVVEDDEGVLRLARTILTRRGYTVLTAQTPAEALAAARGAEGRIDLLVTDVVMPQMSGRDLAARIGDAQPQARVLFMSGYAEDTLGPGGTVDGGIRFIAKPFSAVTLAEAVRTALDA